MNLYTIDNKLKLGFVILVWNSEKVIKNCITSINSMKKIDSHIIIIDNGSTDNTLRIIENEIKSCNIELEIIPFHQNQGTTLTRNVGLLKLFNSTIDFYCILDSDTVVNEQALMLMADEMNKHSEYGMIGPKMITSDGLVQMSARAFPTILEKICKGIPVKSLQKYGEKLEKQSSDDDNSLSYAVDYLMSACWLIRPSALKKVGLLDEKIFYAPEDAEYCIRMWKSGYKVAYCDKAQIIHEWQRLSKKKLISKINWLHIKGLIHMFIKHRYVFSSSNLRKSFPISK